MEVRSQLTLRKHYGIDGDINANPLSPRQVLVVRQEDLEHFSLAPGCLRENIVIKGIKAEAFVPGTGLQFEQGATIQLTFYCTPCKNIAPLVSSLKEIERKRGILGVVLTDGPIALQESVALNPYAFPTLSDVPYERFLYFVNRIPKGKVVTYRQILTGIGVSHSYFRMLPMYIRNAMNTDCPIHRVLDSQGGLVTHIPHQQALLETEGISVEQRADHSLSVSLSIYGWDGALF